MVLNLLKSGHERGGDQIGGNDFSPPNAIIAHPFRHKSVSAIIGIKTQL
jgi:hypothetical protein